MAENLEWSGLPWAGPRWVNVVRSHSILLGATECLHPMRPAGFDARWRSADVLGLARGIHEDGGHARLPILAEALIDAGCNDERMLSHCRSLSHHVRGCWVIELMRQDLRTGSDRAG
jgi:hypothetical protein